MAKSSYPAGEMMGDMTPPEGADNTPAEEAEETASIPISALGGITPKPGEDITLKVISVDEQNGVVTVSASSPTEEQAEPQGSEAAAAEFDNVPTA